MEVEQKLADACEEWFKRDRTGMYGGSLWGFLKYNGNGRYIVEDEKEMQDCCRATKFKKREAGVAHLKTQTHVANKFGVVKSELTAVIRAQKIMRGEYITPLEKKRRWLKTLEEREGIHLRKAMQLESEAETEKRKAQEAVRKAGQFRRKWKL